jgi:phage-related protein
LGTDRLTGVLRRMAGFAARRVPKRSAALFANRPLGMPLIRKLEPELWEVRSHIAQGVARVIFTVDRGVMVLLHAFVKKSQKTPLGDLKTARQRLADLREE